MFKPITVIAMVAALSLQPAAAKLGIGHKASDSGQQNVERPSLVASMLESVTFSIVAIADNSKKSSKPRSQYSYFYNRKECDATESAKPEEVEAAEAEAKEPVGPEPLYFGF